MAAQQGWNQQTPAIQSLLRGAVGTARASGARRSRKRSSKARSAVRKVARSVKRVKKAAGRLKKGSAAAKAYMAKIRKLRGK